MKYKSTSGLHCDKCGEELKEMKNIVLLMKDNGERVLLCAKCEKKRRKELECSEGEINASKEIKKYYTKPIHYGDWYWDVSLEHDENPLSLHTDFTLEKEDISEEIIPLWTIQDCIEFLGQENLSGCDVILDELNVLWNLFLTIGDVEYRFKGNTVLEVFLKAVLKIVKEREDE